MPTIIGKFIGGRLSGDLPALRNLALLGNFNLADGPDNLAHSLRPAAEIFLAVAADLIPAGEVMPVAGTAFDLHTANPLGAVVRSGPFVHNFCLSRYRGSLCEVADVTAGAMAMRIRAT